MASRVAIMKNLSKENKKFLLIAISVFALLLIFGIQKTYAYYHSSDGKSILANKVGDFDLGDGDINMMIYRENDNGKFVRVYTVPAAYYTFNDELTSCTIPCNGENDNCEYSFDETNRKFSLAGNQKLTCKFYFEKEWDSSDIDVYILIESDTSDTTYTYNSKNYELNSVIPAYGYKYSEHYTCDNDSTLTYNSETKKVNVSSTTKDKCYVYFNKNGNSDITVNTYVQSKSGSTTYTLVNNIPANKIYTLNSTNSSCTPASTSDTAGTITYEDGYINVDATSKQVCNVYLDLASNQNQ